MAKDLVEPALSLRTKYLMLVTLSFGWYFKMEESIPPQKNG